MRIIKQLVCEMIEEANSSLEYSCGALDLKHINPTLADLYHKMASTEFQHAKALHEQTVKIVEEQKAKGIKIPESMMDKYEKKHKKYIKLLEKAQTYYNLY